MHKSIYSPQYQAVTQRLRELREGAGMTQRDLAQKLNVPRSTVARIELGERRVDLLEFYRVLVILEADPRREMGALIDRFEELAD